MAGKIYFVRIVLAILVLVLTAAPGAWAGDTEKEFAIKDQQVVTPPQNENPNMTHWLFVECDYWAGCYMPCRGTLKACMKVAHEANWTVLTVHSRVESNLFERSHMQGPIPLPSKPEK